MIGGSYFRVIKLILSADSSSLGKIDIPLINSQIQIKPVKDKCLNEVKRSEFVIDLNQTPDIELRKGDTLVVYLQIGGKMKE